MTHYEAKWKVGNNPTVGGAFYSPWNGCDTTDNMNLIQSVSPWLGSNWVGYTEYYEWDNSYNKNSASFSISPGDVLHGVLQYNTGKESYRLTQTDMTNGQSSTMVIPVEKDPNTGNYKNYTVLYLVYEKVAQCNQYPPEGKVEFYDIIVECNGATITPAWKTGVVDEVCGFQAHVISPSVATITWDTSAPNPTPEQFARSQQSRKTFKP